MGSCCAAASASAYCVTGGDYASRCVDDASGYPSSNYREPQFHGTDALYPYHALATPPGAAAGTHGPDCISAWFSRENQVSTNVAIWEGAHVQYMRPFPCAAGSNGGFGYVDCQNGGTPGGYAGNCTCACAPGYTTSAGAAPNVFCDLCIAVQQYVVSALEADCARQAHGGWV